MENRFDTLGYDLACNLEVQEFGVRDLKPNVCNIVVTEESKLEYNQLWCQLSTSFEKSGRVEEPV